VNNLNVITFYKLHNKVASRACHARRVKRVEPVELDVSSQSSSTCRASRARRVEPCCSTSSTQPKCKGSSNVSRRDEPSGIWAYVITPKLC